MEQYQEFNHQEMMIWELNIDHSNNGYAHSPISEGRTSMDLLSDEYNSWDTASGGAFNTNTTFSASLHHSPSGQEGWRPTFTPSASSLSTSPLSGWEGRFGQRLPHERSGLDEMPSPQNRSTDLLALAGHASAWSPHQTTLSLSIDPAVIPLPRQPTTGPWYPPVDTSEPEQVPAARPPNISQLGPFAAIPEHIRETSGSAPLSLASMEPNMGSLVPGPPSFSGATPTPSTSRPRTNNRRSPNTSRASSRRQTAPHQVSAGWRGRRRGSHLAEPRRQNASLMRKIRSCWPCFYKRKPCSDGVVCEPCLKIPRHICDTTFFPEFTGKFLPEIRSGMDRRQRLEAYFSEFEPGVSPPLWVELTFGYGPTLYCEDLVELLRKDQMPAMTIQYLIDGGSGRVRKVDTQSWTLAFRERDEDKIKDKLGKFMDEMARDDWLLEFPDVAFPNDTLQSEILTAVLHYGRSSMKKQIWDVATRYLILAHTITRTLSICGLTDLNTGTYMPFQHADGNAYVESRPLVQELKYVLGLLLVRQKHVLLEHMYKVFRARKVDNWATALSTLFILGLGLETLQTSYLFVADAEASRGNVTAVEQAGQVCVCIDDGFTKLVRYFERCFREDRHRFNPLGGGDGADEHRAQLQDGAALVFVDTLRGLISSHASYIRDKDQRPPPCLFDDPNDNENDLMETIPLRNSSRLISRVLVTFLS